MKFGNERRLEMMKKIAAAVVYNLTPDLRKFYT